MWHKILDWFKPKPPPSAVDASLIVELQKAHQEEKDYLTKELGTALQLLIAYVLREDGEVIISKELFLIAADGKLTLDLKKGPKDSIVARVLVKEDEDGY